MNEFFEVSCRVSSQLICPCCRRPSQFTRLFPVADPPQLDHQIEHWLRWVKSLTCPDCADNVEPEVYPP